MTEPRIQYAKTEDGVNIAFRTVGQGRPLVLMPGTHYTHLQADLKVPAFRREYEWAAQKGMLIRYDIRGCGMSDRDVSDFSLDAHLLDLEAVVDRLGLKRFALLGGNNLGPVTIAYAARHPDQVSHLILWMARVRGSDESPQQRAFAELRDKDWTLFTNALAGLMGGQAEDVTAVATYLRECVTPEVAKAIYDAGLEFDVTSLLSKVAAPTLVFHRRQYPFLDLNVSKGVAAQVPDARLVLLEGDSGWLHVGDEDATLAAIDEFLGEGEETETGDEGLSSEDVHTILFTDVEGSTALTDRLGDAKARDLLREHERITRDALKAHGGSEVKTLGDGFMASFSSATKALECAIAMQKAFEERNASAPERIKVRIGLNAGEPIAEDDPDGRSDLFGASVNRAARIAAMAQGGEILVANVVRELAEGKEFMFGDRGETALRGFDDPVRLFEVRWRE